MATTATTHSLEARATTRSSAAPARTGFSARNNDDWLYYDGHDIVVNGGNGYDIAIRIDGQSAQGFAMAANGIEELRWDVSGDASVAIRNLTSGDIRVTTTDGGVNTNWVTMTTDYTAVWVAKVQTGSTTPAAAGRSTGISPTPATGATTTPSTTRSAAPPHNTEPTTMAPAGTINWDAVNAGN